KEARLRLLRHRAAHVDGDGATGRGNGGPAGRLAAAGTMAGGEGERGGDAAQRQGGLHVGGGGERGRDAGHHLDADAGRLQGGELLAGAAEDERIARLETRDALALAGEAHEQGIYLRLR